MCNYISTKFNELIMSKAMMKTLIYPGPDPGKTAAGEGGEMQRPFHTNRQNKVKYFLILEQLN